MKKKSGNPKFHLRQNFNLLAVLFIIAAAVLAYSNSFDCELLYDDASSITNQEVIRDLDNFKAVDLWLKVNFRPLSMFTFALNYHFHQLDVTGFHVFNLFIHILSGLLVFLLLKKILNIYWQKEPAVSPDIYFVSLFVSLIFVLHPIQTQSVTYIVQRMTSLAGMFYLLAVYLYLTGRIKQVENGISPASMGLYFGVVLAGILSLLAKQNAVTLPLALLLIELCFIRNKEKKIYWKYIAISFSILIIMFLIIAVSGKLPRETDLISRTNYLITQFKVIIKYLQLLILPIDQNLDHDFPVSGSFWRFAEISSFIVIMFIVTLAIALFKRDKLITFGIGWFFITLALESSIIPISGIIYEHRLYLPVMGFALCFGSIIYHLIAKRNKKLMIILMIFIVISYGYATFQRNKVWKNGYTLWSDVVKKSPDRARPYFNLGRIWTEAGRHQIAMEYYTKALAIKPDLLPALNNLAYARHSLGDSDKAIEIYERMLEIDPDDLQALQNLGLLQYRKNNFEKARWYYEKYLSLNTDNAKIYNYLALILSRQKSYDEAIIYYEKALELDPDFIIPLKNLGVIYFSRGENDKSQKLFEIALSLDPQDAKIWNDLGIVRMRKQEFSEAVECFKKSLELDSDFSAAQQNLKIAEKYLNEDE